MLKTVIVPSLDPGRRPNDEVNNIFGAGAFPAAPARDAQGRATYGLFEQALPPRQIQLALRFTF